MNHLDLFSGIGGFALAAQTVWGSDYHCVGFCEIDGFCQQVLRKNFKGVNIYGDIRTLSVERLIADATGQRLEGGAGAGVQGGSRRPARSYIDLITGGFPCQPFSTAGKRKGTQDDRFLWPEMLRVIREVEPRFIIGENVAGIVEMALGQVCADLEGLDYEVQCFVIPACAVNAPHRRDRVWIVAHNTGNRQFGGGETTEIEEGLQPRPESTRELAGRLEGYDCPSSDPQGEGLEGWTGGKRGTAVSRLGQGDRRWPDWSRDWREVAALTCVHRMDDGVPRRVVRFPDGSTISESKWRQEALKCYGNSIVPQVAMEIMRAIKAVDA